MTTSVPTSAFENRSVPSTPAVVEADAPTPARGRDRVKRRERARAVRRGLLGVALLAAAGGAVLALRPRPVPVDAAQVVRGPLTIAVEESGQARVKDRYVVSAPLTGRVARLAVEPGDAVREGETLAQVSAVPPPLLDARTRAEGTARLDAARAALGQAQAQLARASAANGLAQRELERARTLAASGALPQQALERADFEATIHAEEVASAAFVVKTASEEVRAARAALGQATAGSGRARPVDVVAPVSGKVLKVHQKSATVVQAGAPLLEIGDPRSLEIVVDLLTTDAVRIQPGTAVTVQRWGGEHTIAARVRRIEPSAFTRPSALGIDEQRVNVVIALTDPPERWAALSDGFHVETRLVLWHAPDVLKVPQGAVFRRGDGWAAFRVEGTKTARLVPVTVGQRGESEVEVLAGLPEGTSVAVHPGDRVKDGARIEVR